jgi:hypothetical protein
MQFIDVGTGSTLKELNQDLKRPFEFLVEKESSTK